MPLTRTSLRSLALAGLIAAALPAAAHADSIAYVKVGDVYLSTSDGARQYQVTATGGYSDVSQADDGTMIALSGVRLHRLDPTGKVLADFATPVSDTRPIGSKAFWGPFDPALSPDGSKVAYTYHYVGNGAAPGCEPPACFTYAREGGTGYSHADRMTDWDDAATGRHSGWMHPSWVDDRTTMLSNPTHLPNRDVVLDVVADKSVPVMDWFSDTGTEHIGAGEMTRQRTKLAFVGGAQDQELRLYRVRTFPTQFPPSNGSDQLPESCYFYDGPQGGKYASPTWAPDGARLAWAEGDGVHVASVPDFGAGCTTDGATPTAPLVIAGASEPDWGPADVPPARPVIAPAPSVTPIRHRDADRHRGPGRPRHGLHPAAPEGPDPQARPPRDRARRLPRRTRQGQGSQARPPPGRLPREGARAGGPPDAAAGRLGCEAMLAEALAEWAVGYAPTEADRALADAALRDTLAVAHAARDHPLVRIAGGHEAVAAHVLDYDDLHLPSTTHISRGVRPGGTSGGRGRAGVPGRGGCDGAAGHDSRAGPHYTRGWHATCTAGRARGGGRGGAARAARTRSAWRPRWRSRCRPPAACSARSGRTRRRCRSASPSTPGVRAADLAAAGATRRSGRARPVAGAARRRGQLRGAAARPAAGGEGLPVLLRAAAADRRRARVRAAAGRADPGAHAGEQLTPLIHARPRTGLEGKFSLEYGIAAALLDDRAGLRRLQRRGVARPEARALMERIEVELEPGGDGLLAGTFAIGDVERADPPASDEATKLALCGAEHLAGTTWDDAGRG